MPWNLKAEIKNTVVALDFKPNSGILEKTLDSMAEYTDLVCKVHAQLGHLNIGTMARMAQAGPMYELDCLEARAPDNIECFHCIMCKKNSQTLVSQTDKMR